MTSTTRPPDLDGTYDGPVRIDGPLRRLLISLAPANFSIYLLWGAAGGLLIQLQVADLDPGRKVANMALIGTLGALGAMIAQPIAGVISDRTRSQLGRRTPWILFGAVGGGISLVALGFQSSVPGILVCWMLTQILYNFAQGPLSAVLPDRVPRSARGSFAAVMGLGMMLGVLGGQFVGAGFADAIRVGYIVIAVFAAVVLVAFVVLNPERPSTDTELEPFSALEFLKTFWVNPRQHPDFGWAFLGRLLLYTGYFVVIGYQLYILEDYIDLGDAAARTVPLIALAGMPSTILAIMISGPLSDRFGRRKIFVFLSSSIVAVAMLIPLVMPTVAGMVAMSVVAGFGFGMFQSVDTALMSEVLPSVRTYGKDLGVVNIAATLPQTVAPAVAGVVILVLGGYTALFPVAAALSVLGALAVWPIKAVR